MDVAWTCPFDKLFLDHMLHSVVAAAAPGIIVQYLMPDSGMKGIGYRGAHMNQM